MLVITLSLGEKQNTKVRNVFQFIKMTSHLRITNSLGLDVGIGSLFKKELQCHQCISILVTVSLLINSVFCIPKIEKPINQQRGRCKLSVLVT